jgi:hypothetical protein
MGLAGPYGASNIGESSQRSAVLDPEAKPSLDVRPDVKPCIAQNVKTGDQHLEPNTLGEDVKPDIKPSVDQDVKPDIKPDLYGDDDEEMDEEDYGDDDIVIVPSIPLQGTALQVKAESHVDQKPELFDSEEEEVYSDEEQFDCTC